MNHHHSLHFCLMHAVGQFLLNYNVTVNAESVDGPTPAARVTWSTTIPPECVTVVTVEFRTSRRGPVEATYKTTNKSQTEFIQTGLRCGVYYYIAVNVTRERSGAQDLTLRSRPMQVFVGGKGIVCMRLNWYI